MLKLACQQFLPVQADVGMMVEMQKDILQLSYKNARRE